MRSLVIASLFIAPVSHADQPDAGVPGTGCFAPFTNASDPPLDCPLYYYNSADVTNEPRAFVVRNFMSIDVTASVIRDESVSIEYLFQSTCREDDRVVAETRSPWSYNQYELTITGVSAGDELYIGEQGSFAMTRVGVLQPAGGVCPGRQTAFAMRTCRTDAYHEDCEQPEQPDPETGTASGCSTTGGSVGIGLALLALALGARRRR